MWAKTFSSDLFSLWNTWIKSLTEYIVVNKTLTIEISNNTTNHVTDQNTQNILPITKEKIKNDSLSIDSPMVGIIYLTPKPSSPPFVKKGQKIKKGDTICLIEAMKTFNEIKSDRDCTIKSILVKNGEAVEFGQPLFEIS